MAHSRKAQKVVSHHTTRARKSGRALAKTARHRRGAVSLSVEGFVESVEQYIEAARELQECE